MSIATVTTKGQITIPKEIRDYLKLETGSKVEFVIDESGNVKIVPLNVPVEALSIAATPTINPPNVPFMKRNPIT